MPVPNGLGELARYDWTDHSVDPGNMINGLVRPYVPLEEQQRYMQGSWTDPRVTDIALRAQQMLKGGSISDAQYRALMQRIAPPAASQGG